MKNAKRPKWENEKLSWKLFFIVKMCRAHGLSHRTLCYEIHARTEKAQSKRKSLLCFSFLLPNNRRFPCYNESMAQENFLTVFHSKRDFSSERARELGEEKSEIERGKTENFTCSWERQQVKLSQVWLGHFCMHTKCIHQLMKNSRR